MERLTAEEIEAGDYSQNQVADLLMRVQIAQTALCFVATEIQKLDTSCEFTLRAYQVALNTWSQIQQEHGKNCDEWCSVEPDKKGVYGCRCGLIASAE